MSHVLKGGSDNSAPQVWWVTLRIIMVMITRMKLILSAISTKNILYRFYLLAHIIKSFASRHLGIVTFNNFFFTVLLNLPTDIWFATQLCRLWINQSQKKLMQKYNFYATLVTKRECKSFNLDLTFQMYTKSSHILRLRTEIHKIFAKSRILT